MPKRMLPVVLTVLIIAAAVAVATAVRKAPPAGSSNTTAANTSAASAAADRHDDDQVVTTGLFRSIAKRENPVVVAITTQSHVKTPDVSSFFGGGGDNDFFRRFFGAPGQPGTPNQTPREQVREALGSGFLIGADGEILTNNHVVAGADRIRVALFSEVHKTYEAAVVGRDPLTDSALIKLKNAPANLPTATLGDSDALEPGDWVMAIGNPFQLGHTVTVGVISYNGRPFATSEGRWQKMLQTDASINPGNSGGPLINTRGEVIGVNTAILAGEDGGSNIGIGFAVPVNTVKALLPQLRKGVVERGQLGVQILSAPITQDEVSGLGLPNTQGAIVSRVQPDSPAERAGLRAGDVIVAFNGQPVPDADHLTALVVNTAPDASVPIVYYRNGRRQTTTATIGRLELEGSSQAKGASASAPRIRPHTGRRVGLDRRSAEAAHRYTGRGHRERRSVHAGRRGGPQAG